jgi:hypothetical protein
MRQPPTTPPEVIADYAIVAAVILLVLFVAFAFWDAD